MTTLLLWLLLCNVMAGVIEIFKVVLCLPSFTFVCM